MASSSDNISMAVFCDFENVALGVRDANYEKFDIKPVLERLLLKGSIVVKKAYCDWDRYKGFKSTMHEANFELIEIPHVRQSGKNSADIRLVVDALDLCYTKSHVNTFVIISGDSDFSPLVSKLRENAKQVIGVGVKQSTSDLLVANCDEFIFYDDLVREVRRAAAKRDEKKGQQKEPAARRSPDEKAGRREELEARKTQALELVVEMFDALVTERGDSGKIWASLLKDTLKRRRPDFNETYYGFRTFGNLLEEAQSRGLLEFGRDEKSGAYVYRSAAAPVALPAGEQELSAQVEEISADLGQPSVEAGEPVEAVEAERPPKESRRRGRGGRKQREEVQEQPPVEAAAEPQEPVEAAEAAEAPAPIEPVAEPVPEEAPIEAPVEAPPVVEKRRTPRAPRKAAAKKSAPKLEDLPLEDTIEQAIAEPAPAEQPSADVAPVEADLQPPAVLEGADEGEPAAEGQLEAPAAPKRKPIPRGRRPVKPKAPKKQS